MSQEHGAESCHAVSRQVSAENQVPSGHIGQSQPHKTGRLWRVLLLTICLLLGSCPLPWLLHGFWLPAVGRFLVCADPLQPADAIVVLAVGGPQRVVHRVKLY